MRRFLREWRVEFALAAVLAVGVFLLVERLDIRVTLRRSLAGLVDLAGDTLGSLLQAVLPTTLSDLAGLLLIAGVIAVAGWRLRWRLIHSPALTSRTCPRCGSHLHRIHRNALDRMLGATVVSMHRYLCSNSDRRWSGLRVDSGRRGRPQPTEGSTAAGDSP